MIWYAILIPVILSILAYFIWHKNIVWQEMLLPITVSFITILISYYTIKHISMKDVEYNGYVVKEARYYEAWETWRHKTCSYTVSCGKNCTRTVHYDCSYCDYSSSYYEAIDDHGNKFTITKSKFDQLTKKWNSKLYFHELNRSINNHGSCGKDGNMYSILWDGKISSSECSVIENEFENIVKVSHSAFQYPDITDEQADTLHLFKYPLIYDVYKQNAILGLDQFKILNKDSIQTKFEYLNGNLGQKNRVKVFTLLFKNKPIDIAFKQEAYWDGGNQNEIIVCIGLNDKLEIEWVKPFSWCDNKRIIIDNREDIANLKVFKPNEIYNIYNSNINKYFKFKSFKDFNYLTFEPTVNQLLFVYIITIIVSCLCLWWCIKNGFDN